MSMRVAMLGQYPRDEKRIAGGIEAVMVPLLRALARFDDLDLHVITCLPDVKGCQSTTEAGLPLHILQRRRLGRATFHVRDVVGMIRTLRKLSPDVVHAQGLGIYAAAAVHAPYPHIVTAHGIFFREAEFAQGLIPRWRGLMDSFYERRCLSRVRNLISISPYVEQDLLLRAGYKGRIFPIENPVDDVFFGVDAEQEKATLLYAGRVIPRKGLLDLLRALVEVRRKLPEVQLHVAGEAESQPAYVRACWQFIEQYRLSTAVTFLGSLSIEQMAQEYARCAIVVLPSKQETAPVVVAEAMAAARPVVATRVCGVPYMVEDGGSGLLVDYGDVSALADALWHVLGDAQLRRRMGQRGRELAAARFRADVVAAKTRQVYLQLTKERE